MSNIFSGVKAILSICILILLNSCNSMNSEKYNHLANESSPYLLQHAKNPVDWYPWGEEAINKAKAENKLLIISIGYAACHWCHVMEHESFEDTAVSRIMNEHFVNIKVDREERPDIDNVYMTACQLASRGGCGWPLNAFALPDGRPFWAGTYFPKDQWINIMNQFIEYKRDEPEKLEEFADQLTKGIQLNDELQPVQGDFEFLEDEIVTFTELFMNSVDSTRGGRTGSPKFPMPSNYNYLMNYSHLYQSEKAGQLVETTLHEIANGGIYDHIGGGFARYSVDADWFAPHFEKMMYDNGQLVSLYSNAYKQTKNPLYKIRVAETLEWVAREMTDPNGGFYSSLDADSEGEEGKFYVWTENEIDSIFSDESDLELWKDYYNIRTAGNWEKGVNILHVRKRAADFYEKNQISTEQWLPRLNTLNKKLFEARENRVRPGLDDKILTSWNALMLKGYIDAFQAFGNQSYLDAALKNAAFLEREAMQDDNRLNRNYKDGKSVINAFLDDYSTLADAFIALYEITFDESWLEKAQNLVQYSLDHFLSDDGVLFNYTSDLDPPLITAKKEVSDNVIPASNSMMARLLFKLGTYYYNQDYIDQAKRMLASILPQIKEHGQPGFYANWCMMYLDMIHTPYEIAIVGNDHKAFRAKMQEQFVPNAIYLGGATEGTLELLKSKLVEEETYIYVCQNKVCKLPTQDVDRAFSLMD